MRCDAAAQPQRGGGGTNGCRKPECKVGEHTAMF